MDGGGVEGGDCVGVGVLARGGSGRLSGVGGLMGRYQDNRVGSAQLYGKDVAPGDSTFGILFRTKGLEDQIPCLQNRETLDFIVLDEMATQISESRWSCKHRTPRQRVFGRH